MNEALQRELLEAHTEAFNSHTPFTSTLSDTLQAKTNLLLSQLIDELKNINNSLDLVRHKLNEVETAVVRG